MNLFLIDVDNTLYSKELGVFRVIDEKINEYMKIVLKMGSDEISITRMRYQNQYGTTMAGLIRHYRIDPNYFLEYVHDVDIKSLVQTNSALLKKLKSLNAVKIAFTNAPKYHAVTILNALGVTDQFVDIFDIISSDFIGKPNSYPYEKIMRLAKADRYIMADDMEVNLKTAKNIGCTTILVGKSSSKDIDLCVDRFEDIPEDAI